MDRLSTPLLLMFASLGTAAAETVAKPDWQRYFDAQGVQGTFVLLQPAEDFHPLDRIDAELGLDIPVETQHFGRIAGAFPDQPEQDARDFLARHAPSD